MFVKYAFQIMVISLPCSENKYLCLSLIPEYLIYLRLFQTLDTVDAAKAFIEDNKIAVIGFFKVPFLLFSPTLLNLEVPSGVPLLSSSCFYLKEILPVYEKYPVLKRLSAYRNVYFVVL